ncbi:MAG: hypothetical protein MI861_10165 [Pirellulales bacterium]|nr:hypothetical protein [Pirellulales bacterium]
MALPPWTIEVLRRGISDVARKASKPPTLAKIKSQASEILQELPETAARSIHAVMRTAESGAKSVEKWSRKHTTFAVPMINASGVLITDAGTGVPLADRVVEIGREFFNGDVRSDAEIDARLARRVAKSLPGGSDLDLLVTNNFSAALSALSLLVQQMQLVVHRHHCVRLPDGNPLADSFGMLVPVIQEVGAVGNVVATDFEGLDNFCAIVADGGSHPVELLELPDCAFLQAVVLPVGSIYEGVHESIPAAETLLTGGADFVVLPGDGLNGGPPCGIIVGRREGTDLIRSSSAWSALEAGSAIRAMVMMALEDRANGPNPVQTLLNVSEENLKWRAERMAARFNGCESITRCQVTNDQARLTAAGRWRFPSRQIRLRHGNWSASQWASKLQEEVPSVAAVAEGDDLKLDLRWVAAADDAQLIEQLGGSAQADQDADEEASQPD